MSEPTDNPIITSRDVYGTEILQRRIRHLESEVRRLENTNRLLRLLLEQPTEEEGKETP